MRPRNRRPDAGSTVTITGGTNGNFADILGTGAAAQLSIANQVLLWGTMAVGGTRDACIVGQSRP